MTGRSASEVATISKELLALGNVISAATAHSLKHVPYRDSLLTRFLKVRNTCWCPIPIIILVRGESGLRLKVLFPPTISKGWLESRVHCLLSLLIANAVTHLQLWGHLKGYIRSNQPLSVQHVGTIQCHHEPHKM